MISGFADEYKRQGFWVKRGQRAGWGEWSVPGSGSSAGRYLGSYLHLGLSMRSQAVIGEANCEKLVAARWRESLRMDALEQNGLGENRMRQNGMCDSNALLRMGAAQ